MGVDHNAYIGPYLRVTATVVRKEIDYCASHDRQNAAFCPLCGRSEKQRIYAYESDTAPDDWRDYKGRDFSDYLVSTSVMSAPENINGKRTYIYLPNGHDKELNIPPMEGREVPFDFNVAEITKKFEEIFKNEIEYLKQWFEVETKFGYVSWCS